MPRRHSFREDDPKTLSGRVSIVCRKFWDGSVAQMAADLDITLSALCSVLNGKRAAGREILTAIVVKSPVNAAWLLTGTGDPLVTQPFLPVTDHPLAGAPKDQADMLDGQHRPASEGMPADLPIQFQGGEPLTEWLTTFAYEHGLSSHEAAKRLVLLCRHGMDVRHYGPVLELAKAMGYGDVEFPAACEQIYVCVRGEEHAHEAHREKLSAERRHETIMEAITSKIRQYQVARGIFNDEQQEEREQNRLTSY